MDIAKDAGDNWEWKQNLQLSVEDLLYLLVVKHFYIILCKFRTK